MVRRDREGTIYHKIAADLRRRIESGELAAGGSLGTGKALMYEFDVGKWAIAAAIDLLRAEGYVEPARPGRVVTVAERLPRQEVIWPLDTLVTGRPATAAEASQYADDGIHVGTMVFVVEQGETVHVYRQDATAIRFR